jgi:hypothetical protein
MNGSLTEQSAYRGGGGAAVEHGGRAGAGGDRNLQRATCLRQSTVHKAYSRENWFSHKII